MISHKELTSGACNESSSDASKAGEVGDPLVMKRIRMGVLAGSKRRAPKTLGVPLLATALPCMIRANEDVYSFGLGSLAKARGAVLRAATCGREDVA